MLLLYGSRKKQLLKKVSSTWGPTGAVPGVAKEFGARMQVAESDGDKGVCWRPSGTDGPSFALFPCHEEQLRVSVEKAN